MAHVEYNQWAGLLSRICSRYLENKHPSVLEIGGGTGVLGTMLIREGYSYTGSDLSFAMCREAVGRTVPFACVDGRALPFKVQFNLVIFLYDGINYLLSEHDYKALFTEVHRVLAPNGLFLFDITTQANSLSYFVNRYECEDFGDCYCMRYSRYDRKTAIQYNDFTLFSRDREHPDLFIKQTDTHIQKVLPARTIRSWVPRELFEIAGIWDGYSTKPAARNSERIHFLLRKKGRPQ